MSEDAVNATPVYVTRPFGNLFAEGTRNGLTRPKAVRGVGVKMVNMGELFANPTLRNTAMDRAPLSEAEAGRFLLEPGDLLFARQSLVLEGAGKCSIFLSDDEPVTFESHITRVRLDARKADPRFYFYYLQSHHGRAAITSIVEQGAGASGIRGSDLEKLAVMWRPLPEQSAIAETLSVFDDKIEQNRRTAQALERLARAIFRAWFVDFEPVKAKAAGAAAFPSMPQRVFDALPTRFVDSAIGPVPEGWEVLRLDGVLTLQRGFDLPKQSRTSGSHPVLAASGLNGWHSEWKVKGPGVTTGRSGVLGQVFFVDRDFWPLNTSLWVKEYKRSNPWHTYFLLQTLGLAQFNAGSAVPTLNRNHVHSLPIVAPPEGPLWAFEKTCRSTFALDQQIHSEIERLAVMRDYLLPKLLAGDVRAN